MKLHWLIPNLISALCLTALGFTAPAEAGQLTAWQYQSGQNQLQFTTNEGVQPRAQLVFDPTRLVIDLPGTTIGAVSTSQTIGAAIQTIRIGQFDGQTTRIVIELSSGYTIDPQQVRFRGLSPTEWTVQLPLPQPVNAANGTGAMPASATATPAANSAANPNGTAVLPALPTASRPTFNPGFSPATSGLPARTRPLLNSPASPTSKPLASVPAISSPSPTPQAAPSALSPVSPALPSVTAARLRSLSQPVQSAIPAASPVASPDLTTVPKSAPLSLPQTAQPATSARRSASPAEQAVAGRFSVPGVQLATIQGIDLDSNSNQLMIQTDRPVAHQAQWQSGLYMITISPAQLAARVTGPQLTPADPLRRVRLRQVDSQTVSILIQAAPGVQFGPLNLVTPQTLALAIQRPMPNPTPIARLSNNLSNGSLNNAFNNFSNHSLPNSLPTVTPNGRIVVAIDPGHGGGDVGAVGIGGIHEADIVLLIAQQVAAILQQQGIQAVLTRSSDVEIELQPRVDTAEQARANLFVSIHANSMGMGRPDINGAETYYYDSGAALARTIQNSIVSGTGIDDRGIHEARFYVLRKSSMPSVLVETGFVTGNQDATRLASREFQNQMAIAIARGILQYIQQQSMVGSR